MAWLLPRLFRRRPPRLLTTPDDRWATSHLQPTCLACHCPCLGLSSQAIPAALAGKENAVAEDSRALVGGGLALESSSAQVGSERVGERAASKQLVLCGVG